MMDTGNGSIPSNGSSGDNNGLLAHPDGRILQAEVLVNTEAKFDKAKLISALEPRVRDASWSRCPDLSAVVSRIQIWGEDEELLTGANLPGRDDCIHWHVYKLDPNGGQAEHMDEGGEEEESSVHAARHWLMPSEDFDGLWETLIFDDDLKASLLNYAAGTMLFAQYKVDPKVISWNKVILLHGPPGTGKTSLCQALAHKLSIRLGDTYNYGQLIEINSHSLFSRWFSESGKLVQKMFETLQSLVDDPEALVCVLIDEVESLAAARSSSGSEPSDAIRVVNAMLTQLDAIKRYPNVLIFTTSNITGAIDLAFVDRADIKRFIGTPSKEAIYQILFGCVEELETKCLVSTLHDGLQDVRALRSKKCPPGPLSERLLALAERCVGFSGRTIRKLPFLAFSALLTTEKKLPVGLMDFLGGLDKAIADQISDREKLAEKK